MLVLGLELREAPPVSRELTVRASSSTGPSTLPFKENEYWLSFRSSYSSRLEREDESERLGPSSCSIIRTSIVMRRCRIEESEDLEDAVPSPASYEMASPRDSSDVIQSVSLSSSVHSISKV